MGSGRNKAVRYWLMRPESGQFAVNDEVDKIKWLNATDATTKLSYRKERAVLARAMEMVAEPNSGRVHLVRHAAAGTRAKNERDWKRSLSKKGKRQADKLARLLSKHPVVEIRTSKFVRSVATVRPLELALAIPTIKDSRLAEGKTLDDILEVISDLAGKTAVLCSHRDMISILMDHLDQQGIDLGEQPEWGKASVWTLETLKGRVTGASYRKPPS